MPSINKERISLHTFVKGNIEFERTYGENVELKKKKKV